MEGGGGGECKTLVNDSFYLLYVLSYSHVLIFPSIILTVKLSSQYSLSEERETWNTGRHSLFTSWAGG